MYMLVQLPNKARRRHWILYSWSYRHLRAAQPECRELNTDSRSAICTLNC